MNNSRSLQRLRGVLETCLKSVCLLYARYRLHALPGGVRLIVVSHTPPNKGNGLFFGLRFWLLLPLEQLHHR